MAVSDDNPDDKKMPLLDHLIELRTRLIYSLVAFVVIFFGAFYFATPIFNFLVQPLADIWQGQEGRRLIFTALTEKFFTNVKVAAFTAAFIGFPFIATQIWLFVAPGLYRNEKQALLPFLVATPFMFFLGGALAYYFVFPTAWKFFLTFEQMAAGDATALPILLEPKVNEYLTLVMQLIFAFGIAFEMPVLLTLLVRVGILSVEGLVSKRRYAIVLAFIMAAVLTPPDPISQIALAVPIILLYEVSIWFGRIIERRRAEAEDEGAEAKI
jgi:sec-independent protein translocase protein TatC